MSDWYPVRLELRPWHVRLRNSYRLYRAIGVPRSLALRHAWYIAGLRVPDTVPSGADLPPEQTEGAGA